MVMNTLTASERSIQIFSVSFVITFWDCLGRNQCIFHNCCVWGIPPPPPFSLDLVYRGISYKLVLIVFGNLCYIITGDIFIPFISRFRILRIPKFCTIITDCLDLFFVLHIIIAIPNLLLDLINFILCLNFVNNINYRGTFNIMNILFKECLIRELISQLLYTSILFFYEYLHPPPPLEFGQLS